MPYPYETATDEQKAIGSWWWCVHHAVHLERLTEPLEDRVGYIVRFKPKSEHKARLRELRPVLRPERIPEKVIKAWVEYYKARVEYNRARVECAKALAEYDKALAEYDKARAEYETEIMALHLEEYPDTKWNGKSIFGGSK